MEIGIIVVVLIGLYFLFKKEKPKPNTSQPPATANSPQQTISKPELSVEDADYSRWVSVLKESNPNIHEFDLFGTKAAILWQKDSSEVEIVCLTGFSKGAPSTKKYDYFTFNIKEWFWAGTQPRGCANQIKEHLKNVQEKIT